MMANFTIVENASSYHDVFEDFVELYNKGVHIKDIKKKLGLSTNTYHKVFHRALDEGRVSYRRIECKPKKEEWQPKNYTYKGDGFYTVTKNNRYIASIIGKERTELFVECMRNCGWDLNRIDEFKRYVYSVYPTHRKVLLR